MAENIEKSLVALLEQSCVISAEQWEQVFAAQKETNRDISQILQDRGIISAEELAILVGLHDEMPFVDIRQYKVEPQALRMIPAAMARQHNALPLAISGESLVVAMGDPTDVLGIDALSARAGMSIEVVKAIPSDIREFINVHYKSSGEIEQQVSSMAESVIRDAAGKIGGGSREIDLSSESPVARTADLILSQAVKDRCSDVHVEPQEDRLRIRFRIDGILHDAMSLPLDVHLPLISRFKILASMNIAERRRPQDGQISIEVDTRKVDVRLATTDTVYGEKLVMRILDKSVALLDLTELGFLADGIQRYREMLKSPFGMILISGPTGSGKTTTLYSSINQINRDERNVMTIEDPVEYRFTDISQIQVNPTAGMTFASGLKALMRLDPDVILVGEIRDTETARIATQAALTGHLVLSSIHANDTVSVIFRLLDLGIEPFLVSSALVGIVAQRMVRRVCPHCKRPAPAPEEERLIYEMEMREKRSEFFYGQGCGSCANTGYRGRTGVHELLMMSDELRHMLLNDASAADIRAKAVEEGMVPMWHNAMIKVKQGITTPYEVLRNVYSIG